MLGNVHSTVLWLAGAQLFADTITTYCAPVGRSTDLSFIQVRTQPLLASTFASTVHVHNLTLGSHSILRGLTLGGQDINTSAFHPHYRTRLLVAAGKQIMVYDTTRLSAPMKTISLTEAASGTISAIACSPFSKTLIAVATSGGFVGLIDLEKEKA